MGFNSAEGSQPKEDSYIFSTLPAEQALVQNSVRAIVQDDRGFLWIGTLGGLHRFDGHKMILVNDLNLTGSSLDLIQVESLKIDSIGDLWIGGVYGELNKIRMADGSIESFSDLTTPFIVPDFPSIQKIHEGSDGIIWLALYPGILRLDPSTRTIEKVDPVFPPDWGESELIGVIPLENGLILVSNSTSVGIYDASTNLISQFFLRENAPPLDEGVLGLHKLNDGSLWVIGPSSFIAEIKGEGLQRNVEPHAIPEGLDLVELEVGKNGDFWMRTPDGQVCIFNPRTKTGTITQLKFDGRVFVEEGWLVSLFYDRTGVMWFGTESYGLVCNDPSSTRFNKLSGRSDAVGDFKHPYLWDIKESGAGVFLAGRYELGFMDSATQHYQRLVVIPDHPILKHGSDLFCIQPLDENRILMGFREMSTGVFDLRDSSYIPVNVENVGAAKAFVEGGRDRVWVLGVDGCALLDTKSLLPISLPSSLIKATEGIEIRTMVIEKTGILWFGTQYKGLIRYNPATGGVMKWVQGDGPNDFSHPGVRSLHLDAKNNLWVGTYGGLVKIKNLDSESLLEVSRVFTTADGLPNNTIYDILPGKDGTFWLSTNLGLSNFDPATELFLNYDKNDGLANNEFNGGAALIGAKDTAYFGGIDGLTWFQLGKDFRNLDPPQVAITQLVIGDNLELSAFELPSVEMIHLPWNQNTIEIKLAALCFQQPTKQRVSYRIPEVDAVWWEAPRNQAIRVTNLPSGTLHFEFKASNNDGVWSDVGVLLLHVATPPWRTLPAIIAYIVAIIMIIGLVRNRHLDHEAQKEATTQKLALADKLTAVGQLAAGMAHDFNNQLQIIMGNAEILRLDLPASYAEHASLDIIIRTGKRAGFLASRLLAYAKDADPARSPINLDEVIRDLLNLVSSFLGARISLDFKPGHGDKCMMANREQIEHLLMNLCLNSRDAIVGNGSIEVLTSLVRTETGEFQCILEVRDSGKGIAAADMDHIFDPFFTTKDEGKGSGLGLSMVNRIVGAHNGFMEVSNNDLGGATFKAVFPFCTSPSVTKAKSSEVPFGYVTKAVTVLVADDEPAVNAITSHILTEAGFTVISVKDGREGIEALKKFPEISIAVLDVVMPVLDGRAVYDYIRESGRNIPVLFCSGFSFSVLKENEFKDIDVPVLAKPFSAEDLLAAISLLGK